MTLFLQRKSMNLILTLMNEFFLILNPLLKTRFLLTLSRNIDCLFNSSPTLLPIITPPIAGDTTISILFISILFFIKFPKFLEITFKYLGQLKTIADCRYIELCKPEDKTKCPSNNALVFLYKSNIVLILHPFYVIYSIF